MAITQVSLIPEAGRRGVDARDTFVTKQEAFQDSLNSSFIPQFNNMATDIQAMAEFSVFSNPVWEAKAYTADYSVNYNGNCYISTEATIATDVPIVSPKWKQTNASVGGADMQVFTTSGTWTKPAGVSMVRIILCGGGGGGGSGAKSGTTVAQVGLGGGAGGGGGVCDVTIPASLFSDTESVIIGAGGGGGVGVDTGTVADGYYGKNGTSGGSTTFSTFTVSGGGAGGGGRIGSGSGIYSGYGGNSYITDIPDAVYPSTTTLATDYRRFFNGASSTASFGTSYTSKTYHTVFGGCSPRDFLTRSSAPYVVYGGAPTSLFGGSSGAYGNGIYLSDGTSTRAIHGAGSRNIPTKFLPSYFGDYATLGGAAGTASLTANGTSGGDGTGYGASGGGGGGCTENYTSGNGGNGSSGIAIIISW